jgi:hypothetical protein
MGVSFTLRGLNTQLSLIRKAGYPIHVAQDICGSYYLNLDMSASLFDNIFWFKSTNPDLVDDPKYIINGVDVYNLYNNSTDQFYHSFDNVILDFNYDVTMKFSFTPQAVPSDYGDGAPILFSIGETGNTEHSEALYISSSLRNWNNLLLYSDGGSWKDTTLSAATEGVENKLLFKWNANNKQLSIYHQLASSFVSWENMETTSGNKLTNLEYDRSPVINTNTDQSWNIIVGNYWPWVWTSSNKNRPFVGTIHSVIIENKTLPILRDGDVNYYVDSNYWPDISYSHGLITNPDPGVAGARRDIDTFYVQPYLRFIGPAWLAKNITGGYNNSDLFENEDALQRQFVNFNGNFYKYVRFVFKSLVDASFGDPNGEYYTTDVSSASGFKRGFVGLEDVKFYENNTQIQVSDISAITYSSIYGTYEEGSLLEASFNHLFDDSSGTFWISSEVDTLDDLLYEASDPSINDASYIELGVYTRKYTGNKTTPYTLQLKDNDNQYVTQSISGEWLQFEFKENVSFSKIDFRPVGDHTPDTDISFVGTIPRSIAILTSLDGTNWEVLNDYDNLNINIASNPFTSNPTYYKPLIFPNIKREITGVLDASGGSASNPLTNADTGFNNISRDILKNMLDSDDPATVQRVHTMIENSHIDASNNGVVTSQIDPWIPIEFHAGDKMEFSLTYGISNITDSSNVALNSSGNRLGSNVVEDQDYYVRIHMK